MPIIINTINRLTRWSTAHISDEVLETHPSFANHNASTSIGFPRLRVTVETAIFHTCPNPILRGFAVTSKPMPSKCFGDRFCTETAATKGMSTPEITGQNYCFFTADTDAVPEALFVDVDAIEAFHRQPFKLLSNNVNGFHSHMITQKPFYYQAGVA